MISRDNEGEGSEEQLAVARMPTTSKILSSKARKRKLNLSAARQARAFHMKRAPCPFSWGVLLCDVATTQFLSTRTPNPCRVEQPTYPDMLVYA
jgi:hypothetical protein